MTDTLDRPALSAPIVSIPATVARLIPLALVVLLAALLAWIVGIGYHALAAEDEALTESTPYALMTWVADQSLQPQPTSLLAQLAKGWAAARGLDALSPSQAIVFAQQSVLAGCMLAGLAGVAAAAGIVLRARWTRYLLTIILVWCIVLLFLLPVVAGSSAPALVLLTMGLLLASLALIPGRINAVTGFVMAFSVLLMTWETSKALADIVGMGVRIPQSGWQVTNYDTLDEALVGLQAGEVRAVFADKNDLETRMPMAFMREPLINPAYPDLQAVPLEGNEQQIIFPLMPSLPGRLVVAVRAEDATTIQRPSQLVDGAVGAVSGEFATTKFLNLPRSMTLLDLKILNDLNLPHVQDIAKAFLQPARRNGDFLLVRILGAAGLYTWGEAVIGFIFGALLGLVLGVLFAHSRLMERAFLPYVVASQTVPILAIAPMVVIWLGASPLSVAVIAVYITFFPVAINTLRGLTSPSPISIELMESYAASRWDILWKLRFPSALPYIFTALKVSATASVVGAIIGELPSGMGDGLGRAILDFSSDYSLVSTPKLWAAIVTAALVGVTFYVMVTTAERVVLRRYIRSASV